MQIGVPKETADGEKRCAVVPQNAKRLCAMGADLLLESGLGVAAGFSDADYEEAGAKITTDRGKLLSESDVILRLKKPEKDEVSQLKKGCIHVSYLDPYNERELVETLRAADINAISMEMIPRTTRAQKMDALSSQANLAGYVMVILAARQLNKILPMMMTPAGTIAPARVFVIGAGVAGLQAIATAKRLGARVEAFDTRAVVAEQVRSLGGKFVEIDLGETGQTKDGYAKALTEDQLELQKQGQKKVIAQSDIVITTAQLFGRKAPVIVTRDMIEAMKPGSVVVDMAVESGGNVEGSELDKIVDVNGVSVIGMGNLPSEACRNASEMYSSNLFNLVDEFWDKEGDAGLVLNPDDDIIQGCLITRDGELVNEAIKNHYSN
ncbi:MAG: Re/Si-specific NAD(P)(+) transhydrogenase subunit alpha [Pseudomonadales bacterium]